MTNDISRRTLVRGLGTAALALPVGVWLTGCSKVDTPGSSGSVAADLLALGKKQGYLRVAIANEPPYHQGQPRRHGHGRRAGRLPGGLQAA